MEGQRRQADPFGKNHPMAGRIWSTSARTYVTPTALLSVLRQTRFVLLGENHENEDHHRLQAWIVAALIDEGRRPALVFEMLGTDQEKLLSRYIAEHPHDARGLGAAVDWEKMGWPPWEYYEPVAQAAMDIGMPIFPANLSKSAIVAILKYGLRALSAEELAALRLDEPPPADTLARMKVELAAAHCGLLPDTMVSSMVTVLTVRDAFMASVLARSVHVTGADAAVLIAGIDHTRSDRGVPWHLRRLLPREKILSIGLIEVRDGETNPDSYAAAFQIENLPFDYVWFTPRADAEDPCEKYRDELQRAKVHPYDLVP
jgi:uncharacterized iron-regulated protein